MSEVTDKLSSAGALDLEAITTESCQETIASVMDAFKEMMGLESSSSETDSEYESSLADSLSSRSSEGHNEVHDNVDDVDQEPPRDGDGQSQTSASAKCGGLAADSRKRIRTNSPTDDADGNQKRQKPGTPMEQDTKEPKKKFACPYHKRWPQVQPAHRACVFPGFSTVHRMKEHLFRRHALGIQCRICYESFDDDAGLTQHLSLLNQCPGSGEPSRVGFTIATERKLRERMRGSEEEKWMKIYKTLFEDDEEALNNIPSPYWEYSTGTQDRLSSGYDTSEAFERIQRENVIEIVQDQVIELSRRQQVISTERLLSALPDIFRTAQEEVRNRYPRPHQNPAREAQAANATIILGNSSSHANDPVADRSSGTSTEMLEVPETFEIPADVSPDHLPVNLNTETLLRVPTISESQSADSGYGSMELASSAAYTSADSAHCPLDERNRGGDVGSNDNQPNPSINSGFQAQDDSFATLFLDISDIFSEPSISQETYPHSNDLTHAPLLDSRLPTESSFPSSQPTTVSEQNSYLVQDADNLQADDLSHWLDMDPLVTAGFNVSNTENTFIQAPQTTALSYSSDTHLGSHSLEPAISRSLQSLPNAPASSIPDTRPTNRSTTLHASSRQGQPSTPHPSTHPTIQLLQTSTAPRNFYLQAPEAFYLPTENGGTNLWSDSPGSSGSSSNRSHLGPFGNPALGGSSGNRYDDMLKRLRGPPPGSAS
ncbi:hypothetical protein GTA08_BOTSDO07726 [Botryosphaeria dothidea]|uniref:C2H2-type domain-containing protein n=1 Tax=Botryosphaeria dothidea TaxID=55169 RepID=A0A8H4IPD3_9PEZI|nr:hypothetical protein GTA08_BOTSDO07726 [Botryosphaeria dothidea]